MTMTVIRELDDRVAFVGAPAERKRRFNDLLRDTLIAFEPEQSSGFLCECDRSNCFQTIWLTAGEYTRARVKPGTLCACRHPVGVDFNGEAA